MLSGGLDDVPNPLPVEVAENIFWLGQCTNSKYRGRRIHTGSATFLAAGTDHSAVIEASAHTDLPVVQDQLERLLSERGLPDVRYVFVTHQEVPHAGGIGHLLAKYPDAEGVGGVQDLHLIFPQFAHRLRFGELGDEYPLGGTSLRVVEPVFRDLAFTRWAFETRQRTLFPGDGFAFGHEHDPAHCGHFVEDVSGLDLPIMIQRYCQSAFNWVEYADIKPFTQRLSELIFDELDVGMLLPTHGLAIRDPRGIFPYLEEGLQRGSSTVTEALLR